MQDLITAANRERIAEDKPAKMGFERAGEQEQVRLGDLLWDTHAAGMKLLEFTAGRDLDQFMESDLLQSAAAVLLGIMAERLSPLHRQFPTEYARIAGANRLIELMAEPLAEQARVWRLVEEDLPELVANVRIVLEEWHEA